LTEHVYCVTVAFTNLLHFNGDFSFGKKTEVAGNQIWDVGRLTDLGDMSFVKKACTTAVELAGALSC